MLGYQECSDSHWSDQWQAIALKWSPWAPTHIGQGVPISASECTSSGPRKNPPSPSHAMPECSNFYTCLTIATKRKKCKKECHMVSNTFKSLCAQQFLHSKSLQQNYKLLHQKPIKQITKVFYKKKDLVKHRK